MKVFQGATHFAKCWEHSPPNSLSVFDVLCNEPRVHQYITLIRTQMHEYASEKHWESGGK